MQWLMMDGNCSPKQVWVTREASQVCGFPPSCGCLQFSIRLGSRSGFVLGLAVVRIMQKMGCSQLRPSVEGRIRSIRVRLRVVRWALCARSLLGAEKSFMETQRWAQAKVRFWCHCTSNYFSFVHVHQMCGFLIRKRNLVLILLQLSAHQTIPFLHEDMAVFLQLVLSAEVSQCWQTSAWAESSFHFSPHEWNPHLQLLESSKPKRKQQSQSLECWICLWTPSLMCDGSSDMHASKLSELV